MFSFFSIKVLLSIQKKKNLLVRPYVGARRCWDVRFFRDFNDWGLELVAAFTHHLDSHIPSNEDGDQVRWRLKSNGEFNIHSYYYVLRGSTSFIFPWKGIWSVKAPRQDYFFVWTAAWGKILTVDNIRRRGYTLVDWCCICRSSREVVDHLLLHCR